jgi:hypothetical protein
MQGGWGGRRGEGLNPMRGKSSLRITVPLKDFGQRPIGGAPTLVDHKKCFRTS